MFDAGSAVFTLAAHVVRAGFEDYGRLVDSAERRKEHRIMLGAETSQSGFDKFILGVDSAQKKTEEMGVKAKGTFDVVSGSAEKMAAATGRSLGAVGEVLTKTGEKLAAVGETAKVTAREVESSQARTAETSKTTATEVVHSNQQIIRSNEEVARSYRNPVGGGGGGGRGGGGGGGQPGEDPAKKAENQAKKTSDAYKKGFNALAGLGKWATAGILGVGAVSVKFAADFQRQMDLIHTEADYSAKDVERLKKGVLDLAPAVGVGPTELAKGLYHITSVLQGRGGTNAALEILKYSAEGAKVGMADAQDVASSLSAIWKSQPRDIHSVAEAMGVMHDIVGQGNLRLEDLAKALGTGLVAAGKNAHLGLRDVGAALDTMTSRGIPAEQAATRLRTTFTLMAAPTGKAAAALSQLGMSHDRLATDMQSHGLAYALDDLQHHLNATFPPGGHLTIDQERQALMQYGKQLEASGVHGKTLATDLVKFKQRLEESGGSAIKQSQIITEAFGGSRMGTTMALLMQNADDVHRRFDALNRANAAGRFHNAWKDAQKGFSVQASQLWAGVQRLGIELGDKLIPKVRDAVKWLIEAGKWMGRHKTLANALAIAFGTLLTAAIAAFFARFLMKTAEGVKAIGQFGKYIAVDLPKQFAKGIGDSMGWLGKLKDRLTGVREEAEATGGAVGGVGEGEAAGGGAAAEGGGLAGMAGKVDGMIEGVKGVLAPGSIENPMAVVIMAADRYGLGSQGAAGESQTTTEAASSANQQQDQTPTGTAQPTAAATAETSAATSAEQEARIARQAAQQEFEQAFRGQYGVAPGPHITSATSADVLPPGASKEVQASFTKLQRSTSDAAAAADDLAAAEAEGAKTTSTELRSLYEAIIKADEGLQQLAEEFLRAETQFGASSKEARTAFNALDRALEKLPPAVQKLADEFVGVEERFGTDAKETQTAFGRLVAAIDGTAGEIEGAGATVAEELRGGGAKAASALEGGAAAASGEEEAGGAAVASELRAAGAKAAAEIDAGAATAAEEEVAGGARPSWVGVPPAGAAAGRAAAGAEAGATAAAGESAVVGETAMAGGGMGLMAAGKGVMGKVGGAFLPAAMGLGMGSMAQSALGLRGGTAGTLGGAGVGAAIGMIGGPIGAGIGAAIGSAIGPTVLKFFQGPSLGEAAAKGLSRGFGGAANSQLKKSVQQLIDDGKKSADAAVKGAKFEQAGRMVATQLEAGWNQYKFQDEPTMFKQLRSEIRHMPPFARDAASESAIQFAQGLEKAGRLPKGSAQKMLRQVEAEFPGFTKYMGLTANSSINAFNKALDFKKTQSMVNVAMKRIAGDFPQVQEALSKTKGTAEDKAAAMVKALQGVIKNGTAPMRKQAEADLKHLRDITATDFSAMLNSVNANMGDIHKRVKKDASGAASDAQKQFDKFSGAVQKAMGSGSLATDVGMRMIAEATNQVLSAFGARPIPVPQQVAQQKIMAAVASGRMNAAMATKQTGGKLPGAEFGGGDQMTLIDPLGIPRAKMAGDEAVFTRHQMPYVDAGLRAIGLNGAEGLWGSVNAPHGVGFARGGSLRSHLRGLATGGYAGYSLPLPRSEMMPGSWSIDQGVDIPAPANTPEYAIGPGRIVLEGIQGFGPNTPVLRISAGPLAGRSVYYGHAGPDKVRVGDTVHAGQQISEVGAGIVGISTGPHIEFGYYPLGGMGAGSAMATTLHQLMAGSQITPQGGAGLGGAGPVWQDIKPPKVVGHGKMSDIVRGLLHKTADEVNKWGEAQFASAGFTGTLSGPVEHQVYQFFSQHGFNKIAIAGMLGNAAQESGGNPNTAGGGMWQQISNFGSGTGGSLLHQMETMLPQIMSIRGAMNRAGSPQAAAAIFMNSFERPAAWAANLPHRQAAAAQAFAAGFAKGGRLPHLAAGGRPWAPLPSAVGTLPGFRPPRARRGSGGIHIVGGSRSTPGRSSGASAGKRTSSGKPKTTARTKQPLTQTTANVLDKLGLGTFVNDQNLLGKLDNQYTQQENLFNLFDTSSGAGLPKQDLDKLMGIREQEWDILYKEFQQLPFAVDALQANVSEIQGTRGRPGHWQKIPGSRQKPTRKHPHAGMRWVPAVKPTHGITGTEKEISATENEIAHLQHEVTQDTRAAASARHSATARAMGVADNYASAQSGYLSDLSVIADQRYQLGQQRIALRKQSESITTTGSAGAPSLQSIVSQVMSGNTNPDVSTSAGGSQAKKNIQKQITHLSGQDLQLSHAATQLRAQLRQVTASKNAAARHLRAEGFDSAWRYTVKKWGLEDKITRLKAKLVKLKALLAAEKSHLTAAQGALTQIQAWETGGLQGNTAIIESLGEMGMNVLGLYQEGADLPTPGRSGPTLKQIEDVLTAQPPNGLGLTLPSGLTQGTQTAQQAYADFTAFQASRMALFSQFGSNFVGAGVNPARNAAGLGAGVQFFGGAAGSTAGAGAPGGGFARGGYLGARDDTGPGGTTVNITNNFASGPPDPHTWSAGTSHELNAMV